MAWSAMDAQCMVVQVRLRVDRPPLVSDRLYLLLRCIKVMCFQGEIGQCLHQENRRHELARIAADLGEGFSPERLDGRLVEKDGWSHVAPCKAISRFLRRRWRWRRWLDLIRGRAVLPGLRCSLAGWHASDLPRIGRLWHFASHGDSPSSSLVEEVAAAKVLRRFGAEGLLDHVAPWVDSHSFRSSPGHRTSCR